MKSKIDIILVCVLFAVSLGAIVVGLVGENHCDGERLCTGIEADAIDYPDIRFIDSDGIKAVIDRDFGGYVNKPAGDLDTDLIERILLSQGFIDKCSVWITADGILHVRVSQCAPVLKLSLPGGLWYADDEGNCFEVSGDWAGGLPCMDGQVRMDDRKWLEGVSLLGKWLKDNGQWMNRVSSLHARGNGDIEIGISDRGETFIFGQPEDIEVKFRRIDEYLNKIAPRGIEYTIVSVKYKGQIICK